MIRNLCTGVEKLLADRESNPSVLAKRVGEYLDTYQREIKNGAVRIAEHVAELIARDDVLVAYGHCRTIVTLLERLKRENGDWVNRLLVIESSDEHELARGCHAGGSEGRSMAALAKTLGFAQVSVLPLAAAPKVLTDLGRSGLRCQVLLATYGVMPGGFLCRLGSHALALAANAVRSVREDCVKVVVFADSTKILAGEDALESVLVADRWELSIGTDAASLRPGTDYVPNDLVDVVMTEEGVRAPENMVAENEEGR